ncbi:MAG: 4Fe-4S dicluster domain-containing protein [Deltaproteobacteria bacterium]|nr:4Fe-4S dicluster domain-containing protein [Deltaproteobacteria bacterium]
MGKDKKGMTRKEFLKVSGVAMGIAGGAGVLSVPGKLEAGVKGERWAFIIDLDRCIGCKACAIACKTEFDTRLGVFISQVMYYEHGEYPDTKTDFVPWLCNHCADPPCVPVCPVDPVEAEFKGITFKKRATYQRPDGVVLIDQDRCIGCGECLRNCPYKVRSFDPGKKAGGDPDENPAQKCTFCEHRLAAGVIPSCVNTCQARARIIGDLNDPNSEVSKILKGKKADVLLPDKGTKPMVYYIGKNSKRINDALKKGEDIRKEANSQYQIKIWQEGPYA